MEKRSRKVGRVSEITHLVPFKQGEPERTPGIRYADRCRIVLEAFADLEQEGFASPVRRFGGIHFARWALVDADTRLLFTTNFDGNFEDYIGAFTREIPWSLGLVWSNCVEYPEDQEPIGGVGPRLPGASSYPLFSKFVKRFQTPATLFYAHYAHLTARDIRGLEIFQAETLAALEQAVAVSADELLRRTMERQVAVERAYDGLPARPFPHRDCLRPLPGPERARYRARIERPIRELYGYEGETLEAILNEFGLADPSPSTPSPEAR